MLNIPGYQITEELHRGIKTLVYRGYREQDRCPVIFKTLIDDRPALNDLARLQHEYALTKDWREDGLIRAYALVPHQNSLVLILQDIGGTAIKQLLDTGVRHGMALATFLPLALAIARSLSRIHQHQIIHKDINPANLVVNLATGAAQIIDFGISSQLSRETTELQNPGHLEGTLAYLSPEQTGRMNRAMDYRTDFYSLGATFYEMLTGVPPFTANDPMGLVHCHLAKTPLSLHERHPELPPLLNDLVQKLMAKTAEDRYQSAAGLIADLETCQEQFNTAQTIAVFPLGQYDVSERFQIPQKLYGREPEVQQVLEAFTRVTQGQTELLLVAGYSGVGKTALVSEVHKPITESNGYFIAGKFDQFQRDIPYASLIDAFQELLRQLLTESPVRIARWKTLLQDSLGVNAQVIIQVIPEVELILGRQDAVPELPPSQAQNRFNRVFQQFIRVFTQAEHPLVLFLDDLQWADFPSLQLLKLFMSDQESEYLLIIGAYRDNEVQATHPLILTLEEIRKTATKLETITLKPLDGGHIQQLLVETLHCEREQCQALAELCLQKTQGNPFFLSQFLLALAEAQQIEFNLTTQHWQWDMETLQHSQMTTNVVDLMAAKIQTLPKTAQAVIQLAACVGQTFDLNTLAWASEQSTAATVQALWPALQENLIVPLDSAYKYVGLERQEAEPGEQEAVSVQINPGFRFVHDRVQQAAYSLIGDGSKAAFHLNIGRLLTARLSLEEREERIFDLVYHCNRGRTLLAERSEIEELARLNLRAGTKAKSSAAYKPALNYFQVGLELVGTDGWEKQYDLILLLYVEATEAAYLSGDFELMDHLAKTALQKARTLLDQVKVYQIQVVARIDQNQSLAAIGIALPVLSQLGVKLPPQPTMSDVMDGLGATNLALTGTSIEALAELPAMTDANAIAAMQILAGIGPAAYFSLPQLLPLIFCEQVQLSVKYGNTGLSAYAYGGYGLILCGALGEIDEGYRFGTLAVSTVEHFSEKALNAKVRNVVEAFIRHWKDPYQERLGPLLEVYQSGVQTGNLADTAYAAYHYCVCLYLTGRELQGTQREMAKYASIMIQFKQEQTLQWQEIQQQAISNLLSSCDDPWLLIGSIYDERTTSISEDNRTATFLFNFNKLILCYLFQQYPQALERSLVAERNLDGILSHPSVPVCYFYMALVRLAILAQVPISERDDILEKLVSLRQQLEKWAQHGPMNLLHKWHLVEAEWARVGDNDLAAMDHYDQAIDLARKNDFPQEEALANELAARFYFAKGRKKVAKTYLLDAHHGYQRWGAVAKVKHLEAQYPELLGRTAKAVSSAATATAASQPTTHGTSTLALDSQALDLTTVMKATQTISGEIVLGQLLEKLMRIVIENAGAQQGALLLETAGEWRIEAEGAVDDAAISVLQSKPLIAASADGRSSSPSLPVSLIQYAALTKTAVVLDAATSQGRFTSDPYIVQNRPKSVLCSPILQQGKLAGMLYLENNLMEGAFTADRLEVLKILSSQAAISIENSRVYQNLEATVSQRTAALQSTLQDLRATQAQLIQAEKMASLGQLVANVAHEINTPIGAVKSSGQNIADALDDALMNLPKLFALLEPQPYGLFIQLLRQAKAQTVALTTREERAAKNQVAKQLESAGVADADRKARTLVKLRAQSAPLDYLSLLQHPECDFILDTADNIGGIINSTKTINTAVDRVSKIVTTLRSFVQADSVGEMFDADLKDGIEAVLTIYYNQIKQGTELVRQYEDIPALPCLPDELKQVWTHLIHNALQAMGYQGRLTIGLKQLGNEAVVSFADTGSGIPDEIRSRIFEPFFTTRPAGEGAGLGLDIVKKIVDKHKGRIAVQTEVGVGSTFSVFLPLAVEA